MPQEKLARAFSAFAYFIGRGFRSLVSLATGIKVQEEDTLVKGKEKETRVNGKEQKKETRVNSKKKDKEAPVNDKDTAEEEEVGAASWFPWPLAARNETRANSKVPAKGEQVNGER